MEGGVRKDQRGGEVVGDADAGERVGGGAGREVLRGEAVEVRGVLQQSELCRHAERLLTGPQPAGQM